MEDFRERVHLKVQEVPAGKLTTYGGVAAALGSKSVARHVGWALRDGNCEAEGTPWWRVVNAKGEISYRSDDVEAAGETSGSKQEDRLRAEGVEFASRRAGDTRKIKDFSTLLHEF
jgi:alkylated DNA nucleotide flippase Atl1